MIANAAFLAAVTLFLVWHVWRKRQRAAQPA